MFCKILSVYFIGMTELGVAAAQLPNSKNGSCGIVCNNVQLKIVDTENGKILGPNQPGEIWVKIPSIMTGYYKNPEATKSTIDKEGKKILPVIIYNLNNIDLIIF